MGGRLDGQTDIVCFRLFFLTQCVLVWFCSCIFSVSFCLIVFHSWCSVVMEDPKQLMISIWNVCMVTFGKSIVHRACILLPL